MAAVFLALGVGATTAVFTLVDRAMPHAAPIVTCETMMDFSSDPNMAALTDLPEAAGDAIESLPELAESLSQPLVLALLGAGALALLVGCTRAASRLVDSPRLSPLAAGTVAGALAFAAISLRALALPAMGVRAAAFAGCISLVTAYFAISSVHPRLSPGAQWNADSSSQPSRCSPSPHARNSPRTSRSPISR